MFQYNGIATSPPTQQGYGVTLGATTNYYHHEQRQICGGRSYHPKTEFSVLETAPLTFPYQYWYLAQHGTCGSQYEPLKTHGGGGASPMGSKAARVMRCSVRVLLPLVSISRLGPLPAGMVAETARARARGKESTAQKRIFVD